MSVESREVFSPITLLRRNVRIGPLLKEIDAQPELWDRNVFRTMGGYGNPHTRLSDIVVRFNHWKNWRGDRAMFNAQHESVWWEAYEKLPAIRPMVFDLMRIMEAEQLGMVLITRIPPHTNCDPHVDRGWHAHHYAKFAVQLRAARGQRFCFEDHSLETLPGDLYAFDNCQPHWVENPTDEERITLIMCLRCKQETCLDCHWDGKS